MWIILDSYAANVLLHGLLRQIQCLHGFAGLNTKNLLF